MNKNYRIRVGVIILQDNKILIVKMHRENSKDIYVLPGGGLELGEDIFETAIREVKEETNLKIAIKRILYIKSLYQKNGGSIEIILLGNVLEGKLKKGFDPEDKGKNILKDVKYIKLSKLKNINFHPKQLKILLERDFKNKFNKRCKYLGNFKYPEL